MIKLLKVPFLLFHKLDFHELAWFFIFLFFYPQFKLLTHHQWKSSSFKLYISGVKGSRSAGLNLSRQLHRGYTADRYDLHVSACGVHTRRYATTGTIRYWRQASSIKDSPLLEKQNRETVFYFFSWYSGMAGVELLLLASFFVCCCVFAAGRILIQLKHTKPVQLFFQLLRVLWYDGRCPAERKHCWQQKQQRNGSSLL